MSTTPGNNDHFSTDALRGNLRRTSVRASAVTVAAQGAVVMLNLAATVVLARLLTPADFGLIAMVTVFIGFTVMLRDLGLSSATIQRTDIDHQKVSTLFWINATAGLALSLLIAACAPLIAWFYERPDLVAVTLALATLSLLDGLAIQHQALLRRQLRMGALAAIELVSLGGGIVCAIVLAWRGAGVWALVFMQLVTMALKTALTWLASGWRPQAAFELADVRTMLAFGGQLTGARMLNYASRNVDKLLIGKFWSAQELGIYAKAIAGAVLPFEKVIHALSRVAVPTLSRLQDEPQRFRVYFRMAALLLFSGVLPITVAIMLEAEPAVRIVLGDQWLAMAPLLRILAPIAVVQVLAAAVRWVLVSLGRGERLLRWRIIETLAKVLAIIAGLQWGVLGIATALLIVNIALIVPGLTYCFYESPLSSRDVGGAAWRPLTAASLAAVVVLGVRLTTLGEASFGTAFGIEILLLGASYAVFWVLLPGGLASLRALGRLTADLRSAPPKPANTG